MSLAPRRTAQDRQRVSGAPRSTESVAARESTAGALNEALLELTRLCRIKAKGAVVTLADLGIHGQARRDGHDEFRSLVTPGARRPRDERAAESHMPSAEQPVRQLYLEGVAMVRKPEQHYPRPAARDCECGLSSRRVKKSSSVGRTKLTMSPVSRLRYFPTLKIWRSATCGGRWSSIS
jgi:hypothetical protein